MNPDATPENAPDAPPAPTEPPTVADTLAAAVTKLMQATAAGDADGAHAALSESLSAFGLSTAESYTDGIPCEGTDYVLEKSETGIRVEPKSKNGELLCSKWGEYTREMEYRALQQRVAMLSHVVAAQQEQLKRQQKQMDNVLMQFDQVRKKIRF